MRSNKVQCRKGRICQSTDRGKGGGEGAINGFEGKKGQLERRGCMICAQDIWERGCIRSESNNERMSQESKYKITTAEPNVVRQELNFASSSALYYSNGPFTFTLSCACKRTSFFFLIYFT